MIKIPLKKIVEKKFAKAMNPLHREISAKRAKSIKEMKKEMNDW